MVRDLLNTYGCVTNLFVYYMLRDVPRSSVRYALRRAPACSHSHVWTKHFTIMCPCGAEYITVGVPRRFNTYDSKRTVVVNMHNIINRVISLAVGNYIALTPSLFKREFSIMHAHNIHGIRTMLCSLSQCRHIKDATLLNIESLRALAKTF